MNRILTLSAFSILLGVSGAFAAADDGLSDIPSASPKKLADVAYIPTSAENIERCPYVQQVTSTSAQIVWRSRKPYRGHLRMGRFSGLLEYEAREAHASPALLA